MELVEKLEKSNGGFMQIDIEPSPATPSTISANLGYFTPADALGAIGPELLPESFCRKWILERIHGTTAACPHCRQVLPVHRQAVTFWAGGSVVCPGCRRKFKATTKTFLAGAHMDFRTLFLLAAFFAVGGKDKEIGDAIGRSSETVRLWRNRFKDAEKLS